jgi:choice-of-anchor C domain-containing protein
MAVAVFGVPQTAKAGVAVTNLVTDGAFDASPACNCAYTTYSGGSTAISGWTVTGDSVDLVNTYWQQAPGYTISVDLSGNAAGGLTQTVPTVAGQHYVGSFWLAGNPDGGNKVKTLYVTLGKLYRTYTFNTTKTSEASMGWKLVTVPFTASGTNTTLTFTSKENSPYGPVVTGLSIVPANTAPAISKKLMSNLKN